MSLENAYTKCVVDNLKTCSKYNRIVDDAARERCHAFVQTACKEEFFMDFLKTQRALNNPHRLKIDVTNNSNPPDWVEKMRSNF